MSLISQTMIDAVNRTLPALAVGQLRSSTGLLTAKLPAAVGDVCDVDADGSQVTVEVIGFDQQTTQMMPYQACQGLRAGARVTCRGRGISIPTGQQLMGRVVDGLGRPLDHGPPLNHCQVVRTAAPPPAAMMRQRIDQPMATGQRAIDALNTIGVGQRIGIFAGSGVGKSTLLGEIAKRADADCCVLALIGERGREVRPFIEDCLGPEGVARSVTVVATSDETPLMRVRAADTAIAMAEAFRAEGAKVLLMLDSLTRFAHAQREIGMLLGEPPSMRGYTPSVFQRLAALLERLGNDQRGSITAMLTVLVDGDDMDDPIADAVRGIVDGHLVLDRKLAEAGHFPAIRISSSLSRVFVDVATPQHQEAARRLRSAIAVYEEAEDLIRVGAYQQGAAAEVDRAILLRPVIDKFLRQRTGEFSPWDDTQFMLQQASGHWPFD